MSADNEPHIQLAPAAKSRRFRNYFLTGLIIVAPLTITAYLTWNFVGWVDSWVKPYIPQAYNPDNYLPFPIPGFGLITAVVLITLVGFLTANFIGRSIVRYGEFLLGQMPLIRNLYNGLKQIFQTVLAEKANTFKRVALIEYPRPGLYALVFIATDAEGEVGHKLKARAGDTVAVFLPTTPNPTSGFLLFVPVQDLIPLTMTVEEAAKLIISAGLVSPEYQKKVAAAAAEDGIDLNQPALSKRTASSREKR